MARGKMEHKQGGRETPSHYGGPAPLLVFGEVWSTRQGRRGFTTIILNNFASSSRDYHFDTTTIIPKEHLTTG